MLGAMAAAEQRGLNRILVVDDEESLRHMLQLFLTREGFQVASVPGAQAALAELGRSAYDCVLCDVRMPKVSGLDLLDEIARLPHAPTVIMMSAYGSSELALDAMKRGAYDYVSKPFRPDEMLLTLRKAEERERLRRENQSLREALARRAHEVPANAGGIVGKSAPVIALLRTVAKVAEYKTNVLVTGESGTGKELVARALHDLSPRKAGPFIAVNCGAIPEQLLESELFGHKKGSFTDASRDKKGLFEEATEGTLFLDEIGELPLALQVKLLRALQEESIRRIGDARETPIDVRVVAATVRDLGAEVAGGRFREDLFYRLNVLPIHLPPLRERRDDIPLLVEHFLQVYREKNGRQIHGFTRRALELLGDYAWPGNVRELENAIERAVVLTRGQIIGEDDLPREVQDARRGGGDGRVLTFALGTPLAEVERQAIHETLRHTKGDKRLAAQLLGIATRTIYRKLEAEAQGAPLGETEAEPHDDDVEPAAVGRREDDGE
jgi:two-component system response regulator AtoC